MFERESGALTDSGEDTIRDWNMQRVERDDAP